MITQKNTRKKPSLGKIFLAIFVFFALITTYVLFKIFTAPDNEKEGGIFTQIKHLIMSSDKSLAGESSDRINILLMGVGGGSHEGPYLTDTMMLVSIKPSTNQVGMLSIPRDLYVRIPNFGEGKINTAYALTRAKHPELAAESVKSIIETVFGVPVHYYAVIDFQGFAQVVDDLGGITINVENTLDDPYYPIEGGSNRGNGEFEHLVIYKGIRYMNGETALKYVRSRKAKGVEGSDFARSRRQQKVILAIKEKLLSPGTLFNFSKINKIIEALNQHVDTNLQVWEMLRIYDITKDVPLPNINHIVLDDGPKSPLISPTSTDAYILIPRKGDWSDLQNIAKNVFDQNAIENVSYQPLPTPQPKTEETTAAEKIAQTLEKQKKENSIEIDNGTGIVGLAKKTSSYLSVQGYKIIEVGNAPVRSYKKSVIYNLKASLARENKELIKDLEETFDAVVFESGAPQNIVISKNTIIKYPVNPKSDILIILGDNWRTQYLKFQSNVK